MIGSILLIAATLAAAPITAPGPQGPLAGTYVNAGAKSAVVLIIPGSGPTDRDGNNRLGVAAAPYRLLAEALAARGVSSVRIDKRGMFGSKAAIADPNAVTIADYAADTHAWVKAIRQKTKARCVWVLGHSEGGLIALAAAQQPQGICGLILVAAPGRKFGTIIREQLEAQFAAAPAAAPLKAPAMSALDSLEAGKRVDVADIPAPFMPLFAPQVQPFLIDLLHQDPAALVRSAKLPVLIVQGGKDIQVSKVDAEALHAARPDSKLLIVPAMNHVLKDVAANDRTANVATYANPDLPVDSTLVDTIAAFVKR
jgi:pimeloyl-ACP methyl ester carboxylesterase